MTVDGAARGRCFPHAVHGCQDAGMAYDEDLADRELVGREPGFEAK
ncbi:hypothetical protein B0E53_01439 [Micromonospora sp. MH33]|nr:hypothetical protein [Micromonospora sp. MH33]PSK66560.1 hypothetical protein B0E53_01439 [Micromonospora sp. MH33]